MEFRTVIGLEVHTQVLTETKMFCGCSAAASDVPNTHVCAVCLGMPGVLPTVNRAAVEKTVMTGLALDCTIPRFNRFDRKNYMYPDQMKGYQISQYELPMAVSGFLDVEVEGETTRVGITRVHLEEDTARLVHRSGPDGDYSLVDVNRSGVPLMEIVSDPDITSPQQARLYLVALRRILRYIGASSGNMEEGALRCDANISQRSEDGLIVGPKVEIKNMNSFRSVERALDYEIERQRAALRNGETLVQETRGWVETQGITVSQRTKEFADDYRYLPEPDLPPVEFDEAWIGMISTSMAELPVARRDRFVADFGLSFHDADVLTDDVIVADYYEQAIASSGGHYREVATWVSGELFALARNRGGFEYVTVTPEHLSEIVTMVASGEINALTGKSVLLDTAESGTAPRQIVMDQGLTQVSDASIVDDVVREIVAANPKAVEDYRSGKQAVVGFLIGQAMKQMRGRGNPDVVRQALLRTLDNT
ncbi:MAG: Asp-tRNA(Asn)/Glu-tRNA(Gln) amidotransferase subunit GatB [Chloroflexia bacterium]|nr:Asp-tRNA(Asn)/Glu-tRNA(Gln) amidotransferase subunit GatB [Chloroflexia bacterium]